MQIADIHALTAYLDSEEWEADFEDDQEREEFKDALKEMYDRASEDVDALYVFFEFITNQKGSSGAYYEWDSEEFKTSFEEAFRKSGRTAAEVIKDHYSEFGDDALSPILADRHAKDFFDWEGYVEAHRRDLSLKWRGSTVYLFEGE